MDSATNVPLTSLSEEQSRALQQRLQLLGYPHPTIDGRVGERTRAARSRCFQRPAEQA